MLLMTSIAIAGISSGVQAKPLPINTKLGGDFELTSTHRQKSDSAEFGTGKLSEFKGKVVLLNFGYTSCPDICPMVVARITQVLKRLGDDKAGVQSVFVTFDPERDTAARLKEYLDFFDGSIVGFTGELEDIRKAAKQYGVIFMPTQGESASGTLYAHSDFIYLLDKQGRVRALFATDKPLLDMVNDVRDLLSE